MGSLGVYVCLLKIPVRSLARDKEIGKNVLCLPFCGIWIGAHSQKKQPGVWRGKNPTPETNSCREGKLKCKNIPNFNGIFQTSFAANSLENVSALHGGH